MEYFGSLVNVMRKENYYTVVLNVFPKVELDIYSDIRIWESDFSESTSSSYIEFKISKALLEKSNNKRKGVNKVYPYNFRENQWYQLETDSGGEIFGLFYKDINTLDPQKIKINNLKFIDGRSTIGRELNKTFELVLPDSSEQEINAVLGDYNPNFVAVYNVGQGSCNAICDEDGKPLVYYDMGGGYGSHSMTYPKGVDFCFSSKQPIILSHWHEDHWRAALDPFNNDAIKSSWIVPRQTLRPGAFNLAVEIHKKGRLLIWPKSLTSLKVSVGQVLKCGGTSINSSGLALIVVIASKDDVIENLLPGDSRYVHIPQVHLNKYDNLVVTHHGGVNPGKIPVPKYIDNNVHVYSYGSPNHYTHPRASTITEHNVQSWKNRKDSLGGSIAIGKNLKLTKINKHVSSHSCCNLFIVQI
ncbi:hypothetical protein [Sporosarcina psychrophila]|uniref:hypothetical protein n=1 Tax=Sporosarcina psychrophila TaxID=1476 RepID=UPI00078B75A7|nr:hypothetical protein [Sporosarcina psychrophila]AMQ05227.1 hypothetical protein AZE41_04345 [Sporosarcina psychrophila]